MTQEEFDEMFMTTKDIAEFMGCTVAAVWYAKERGSLPGGITIKHSKAIIWPRASIMPKLENWKGFKEDRVIG